MQRRSRAFFALGLPAAIAVAGACSESGSIGSELGGASFGGFAGSTTSAATATTSSSSSGGPACSVDADCPPAPSTCLAYTCDTGGACALGALPDESPCDDGLFCTVDEVCASGVCSGSPRACPAKDACNVGVCVEATQACGLAEANDGQSCDDGNPCDGPGTCASGACQPGPDACASLQTECLVATCMAGVGCVTQPELDGTMCGVSLCSSGICQAGHCDLTAINEGHACDDGLFCTIDDTCQGGFCVGSPNTCPTGAACVQGTCDEASQSCVTSPILDGSPCDDGDACHGGATCADQMCVGGVAPVVLFEETFDDDSHGWTLGPEWQIGPAMASEGQTFGNPDPGTDHTGNAANGVAGVEIGGNAAVASPDPTHPSYYLTSPVIDTAAGGARLYLTFYRWLNSDAAPYMVNTVEASVDGVSWAVIWQTTGVPVTDGAWTFQVLDVTAYEGATSRFRFGFGIGDPGVFTVSSWNLDDVKVQTAPCPG
jgi:hypothetical protein